MAEENFQLHKRGGTAQYEIKRDESGNVLGAVPDNVKSFDGEKKPGGALDAFLSGMDSPTSDEPSPKVETPAPETVLDGGDGGQEDQQLQDDVQPEVAEAEQAKDDTSQDEGDATIADYAEALGVEAEVLYEMVIPTKQPDGTDKPQTVGEMKDELAELRRQTANGVPSETVAELEKKRAELDTMTEQRLAAIGQVESELTDAHMKLAQADGWLTALNGDEGKELAQKDPGRLSLAIQRAHEQKAQAEQAIGQFQQNQQQMIAHKMREEMTRTAQSIDGWMQNGVINLQRVQADQSAWAAKLGPEYGFGEQEIQQTVDHRLVKMMRDLYAYKTMAEQATPENALKVRKPRAKKVLSALAAKRQSLGGSTDERTAALRKKRARELPEHSPERWESINSVWDRFGGAPRRA